MLQSSMSLWQSISRSLLPTVPHYNHLSYACLYGLLLDLGQTGCYLSVFFAQPVVEIQWFFWWNLHYQSKVLKNCRKFLSLNLQHYSTATLFSIFFYCQKKKFMIIFCQQFIVVFYVGYSSIFHFFLLVFQNFLVGFSIVLNSFCTYIFFLVFTTSICTVVMFSVSGIPDLLNIQNCQAAFRIYGRRIQPAFY